jgi:hypothetical protein
MHVYVTQVLAGCWQDVTVNSKVPATELFEKFVFKYGTSVYTTMTVAHAECFFLSISFFAISLPLAEKASDCFLAFTACCVATTCSACGGVPPEKQQALLLRSSCAHI